MLEERLLTDRLKSPDYLVKSTCANTDCGKEFFCLPRMAPRRQACGEECARLLKLQYKRNPHPEFMGHKEIQQLYRAAKKIDVGLYITFRLAINAMLRIKELLKLKIADLLQDDENPCHLRVSGIAIDLDCQTILDVRNWATGRTGKLLPYSKIFIQRGFRASTERGNVYAYTFHALRHTGIMLRAKKVCSYTDLEALRKAARFRSIEALTPYRNAEPSKLVDRVRFPR